MFIFVPGWGVDKWMALDIQSRFFERYRYDCCNFNIIRNVFIYLLFTFIFYY